MKAALAGLAFLLAVAAIVMLMIAPWIYGPDSARLGGTAAVTLIGTVLAGAAAAAAPGRWRR